MPVQSNSPVPPELARYGAWKLNPETIHDGRPARGDDFVFVHLETSIVRGWHF